MIKSKFLPIFILIIFFGKNANAQSSSEISQYVKPISKQDSIKIETEVIKTAEWIIETDLDKEQLKRKKANAFVLQWYIDNISLNISLVEKLSTINEGNADLLLVYFAGFSKYYIENKNSYSKLEAIKVGLISVMSVYKKGLGVTKSQGLENLVKLTDENKLDTYIKDNFNED